MASLPVREALVDDRRCFVCGPDNSIGLHVRFERTGDGAVVASVTVNEEFQGWKGVAHGGIAIALLDEAMAHAALTVGHRGVTANMTTRFRKAVPVAQTLTVSASIVRIRRNVLFITAQLRDRDAHVLADAEGSFVVRG